MQAAYSSLAQIDKYLALIDDLPEILELLKEEKKTQLILFDPNNCHPDKPYYQKFSTWKDIREYLIAS